jgi:hypothetical protein
LCHRGTASPFQVISEIPFIFKGFKMLFNCYKIMSKEFALKSLENSKLFSEKHLKITLNSIIGIHMINLLLLAQQLRERMDKWNYIKLKSFCTTKEMVSKLKRPPTEWEKIFASYTSDKELITRTYGSSKN